MSSVSNCALTGGVEMNILPGRHLVTRRVTAPMEVNQGSARDLCLILLRHQRPPFREGPQTPKRNEK